MADDDPAVSLFGAFAGRLGRVFLTGHPLTCDCPKCLELDRDAHGLSRALAGSARRVPPSPPPQPPPPPPRQLPKSKPVKAKRPKALPSKASAQPLRPSPAPGGDPPEVEVEVFAPGVPLKKR